MLVHNLSDVETPKLKQFGLCAVTVAVGNVLLAPGTSVDVSDTPEVRAELAHMCSVGAVCIGDPPAEYTKGKGGKPAPAPAPVEAPKAPEVESSNKKKRE